MDISASSAAAVGLAALLAVSGFGYLDARNQLDKTQDRLTALQSERDQLNKQVDNLQKEIKDLQQQVSSSNSQASNCKNQLGQSQSAAEAFQGQIETLSTCLEGVAEGMTQMSNGNQAGAIVSFSAVSASCKQAGKIIEQRNSNYTGQGQALTTRTTF